MVNYSEEQQEEQAYLRDQQERDRAIQEYYFNEHLLAESLRVLKWNLDSSKSVLSELQINVTMDLIAQLEQVINPPQGQEPINNDLPF